MLCKNPIGKIAIAGSFAATVLANGIAAGQQEAVPKRLSEPVFRVSRLVQNEESEAPATNDKTVNDEEKPAVASLPSASVAAVPAIPASSAALSSRAPATPHPLDNAIKIAHDGLREMKANIHDYTAILAKRESINGVVGDPNFMRIKIRNRRQTENGTVPFSVYMKFLKPKDVAGREVIWVEGRNENKILAHEAGVLLGLKTFHLDPDGFLAMNGNRHPIYEAGLENLVRKLIEKAERDRAAGDCITEYRQGATINKRSCSLIEVIHTEKREPFEFHKAQVFIDDDLQVPVRYCAWDWPSVPGGDPMLIEEYTYLNVECNVGLTDKDFDPSNPEYSYPGQ